LPHPHWQFLSWQRHSFAGQPQEQVPQLQLGFLAVWAVAFFTFDIVVLLFPVSALALSKRLTNVPRKPYSLREC
jgi:hypothetical protein